MIRANTPARIPSEVPPGSNSTKKGELIVDLNNVELPDKCPRPQCNYRWAPQNSSGTNTYGALAGLKRLFQYPDETMALRFEIPAEDE